MATTVLALPDEVLTEITQLLANDTTTLLCLILACRRIAAIARDILYEDIQLDLKLRMELSHGRNCLIPSKIQAGRSKMELLLRSWREKPILLFQKLKIFTVDGCYSYNRLPQLLIALSRAKSLRILKIKSVWWDMESATMAFQNPLWDHFPNLQILDVDCDTTGGHLASCVLPTLLTHRSLRAIRIGAYFHFDPPPPDLIVPSRGSGLIDLDLTKLPCDCSLLAPILQVTPKLECLKIDLPQDMVAFEYPRRARDDWDDEMWSEVEDLILDPHELGTNLWPVHRTLRSLTITNPRAMVMNQVDNQIDLSAFESLEDLRISSVLLTGDVLRFIDLENLDLTPLLPPNLVNLHICFDTLQGIFHPIEALEQACADTDEPGEPSHSMLWYGSCGNEPFVAHVFSLLKGLATQPTLERVELEETHAKRNLQRRREGIAYIHEEESFILVDVAAYHRQLFSALPFECKISIYVDEEYARLCTPLGWPGGLLGPR